MTTYFDSRLSCRDYASRLLHVGELLEWAKSNRLHLRTTPPIDKDEFIQVENLLCAIERHASNLTPEQALDVVLNDPILKNDPALQKYSDDIDPVRCRWLIGVNAHKKWRELLTDAITAHELTLLDFGSKLPIHTAPAQTAATPAPVVAVGASGGVEFDKAGMLPVEQGLLTKDVAVCFGDCYYSASNWPKRLSGTAWLETACIGRGEAGGASAVWNPLTLARLMHQQTKGSREKEKLMKTLNSRFNRNPVLGSWRDAFNEYFATYCTVD